MSVYNIISRISSVENSVDELSSKADSTNAVLSGTTSINGLVLLNGPVSLTSTINGITKTMVGLGNVDNTSDTSKPISSLTQTALDAKADKFTTYTKTEVIDVIAADISTAIAGKSNTSTTYTVDNVNNLLSGKQKLPDFH